MADRRVGLPGEPGEPGVPPGGAGGRGGQGGEGEHVHYRWVVAFVIIVAIGLGTGTLLLTGHVAGNSSVIKSTLRLLEQSDRAEREANYRICLRQMVVRVTMNFDKHGDEPRLPLYDCTPNLNGGTAKQLSQAQAKAFDAKLRREGYKP